MTNGNKSSSQQGRGRGPRRDTRGAEVSEFDQRVIEVSRVTRVMAGGKSMRFRACVVVGNHKGRIGYGLGKGADFALAVSKAVTRAKKNILDLPITDTTIPHQTKVKFKAAQLLLKPAPEGTGIMAGGAVRQALEVSGIGNIATKVFGSKNKVNNIQALFTAFELMINTARVKKDLLEKREFHKAKKKEKELIHVVSEEKIDEKNS